MATNIIYHTNTFATNSPKITPKPTINQTRVHVPKIENVRKNSLKQLDSKIIQTPLPIRQTYHIENQMPTNISP